MHFSSLFLMPLIPPPLQTIEWKMAVTEGGADEGAQHHRGGNVRVRQQWWWRQQQLVAEINNDKGSSGKGECPYFLCICFVE